MAGRTLNRWTRVYINGGLMSGYTRSIGPLTVEFPPAALTAMNDSIQGSLPDTPTISPGTLNGIFDNTAGSGLHVRFSGSGTYRNLMIPIGDRAEPIAGNPVFMGSFEQLTYQSQEDGGAMTVNMEFGGYEVTQLINYPKPWGWLLHARGAETAVNTGTGIDDYGAATTAGGYMMYQGFGGGNGTVTVKVQDADTNVDGSFADLSGCTSGVVDFTNAVSGIVAIGTTATVQRYLRWQIVLGTATTVNFALAFVRG